MKVCLCLCSTHPFPLDPSLSCRGVWQEYNRILYEEIDYVNEGRNANRFQRNFRPDPLVKIPTVHWQLTSPRVITLTYMPGIKITNVAALKASGLNGAAVARRATEAYLVQILQHGFLHSDPHPVGHARWAVLLRHLPCSRTHHGPYT